MIHRLARIVAGLRIRVTRHFARSLRARRFALVLPSLIAAAAIGTAVSGLNNERSRWKETDTVYIATDAIEAGAEFAAGKIEVIEVPHVVVPVGALTVTPSGVAIRGVGAREILVEADVKPEGSADSMPGDWLVMGVGAVDESLALESGDSIVALADGTVVCDEGRIVSAVRSERSGEVRVSVGVPAACAPEVARAVTESRVILARVPVG